MNPTGRLPLLSRLLAASGALLAASAVGLSAYASHGAEEDARMRLFLAATIAFGHGVALAALAPQATGRWANGALTLMLAGVVGFSGSVVAAHFFGTPTRLAPIGGSLLMLAWLLHAIDRMRR
ncbi:DUF423 domain-containing protein [Lysobacter korlensis]|uniref:DUF423 domain-containing protein n=1 Tax=Lysobacter korlensis TaxID=553636 RepID=A0ABV6RKC0_9GAMM